MPRMPKGRTQREKGVGVLHGNPERRGMGTFLPLRLWVLDPRRSGQGHSSWNWGSWDHLDGKIREQGSRWQCQVSSILGLLGTWRWTVPRQASGASCCPPAALGSRSQAPQSPRTGFRTSPNPSGMKLTAGKKELYPSMAPTAHLEKGSLPQGWVLGYLQAPFVKKATADPPGMAEG